MPNHQTIAIPRAAVASQLGFFSPNPPPAQANHDAIVTHPHSNPAATAHALMVVSQIGMTTSPQQTPSRVPGNTLQQSSSAA